jgi:hypothetical protein
MKIQNVNSQDNNDYYEIMIVCKTDHELDVAWDNLSDEDFAIDHYDHLELTVATKNTDYDTKKEFIAHVRKLIK